MMQNVDLLSGPKAVVLLPGGVLGQVPSVDLLVYRFNSKLHRFVSRYRDPPAETVTKS